MKKVLSFFLCILMLSGCAAKDSIDTETTDSAYTSFEETTESESATETDSSAEHTDTVSSESTTGANSESSSAPPQTTAAAAIEPAADKATDAAPKPSAPQITPKPQTRPDPPETTQPPSAAAKTPEEILRTMTTEELVGQMFLARHPWSKAEDDIKTYSLGGYILFAKDFEGQTPNSIRSKLQNYQSVSKVPMLFAVDEEGGTVTRVSRHSAFRSSPFPSPRDVYNSGGINSIQQTEREKARLLRSIGLNVNMAPVCDITTDPSAFMYKRSLGQSPDITAEFVAATVTVSSSEKVGSVLKHFPGYGNNADTHVGIAVDNRSKDELLNYDLIPFRAGINSGAGAILVSHTIISEVDAERPATLSAPVHNMLRNEMGFTGVIVTDDLSMQAITKAYGTGEAAVMAVLAGNDLLCCTDYAVQYNAVLSAVKSGQIPIDTVKSSVLRLLRWKEKLGLLG